MVKSIKNNQQKPKKSARIWQKLAGLTLLGTATATAISAIGAVSAWRYFNMQHQHRRQMLSNNPKVVVKCYQGKIYQQYQYLVLTTASTSYAIHDPFGVIDSLAKEQQITDKHYNFEVCVMGEVSQKGQYGYLGQLDYQLTITGRCDDSLPYNQVEFNKEKS